MRFQGCGNSHKWLNSPPGSAFLYARREVQHLLEPLVVSWGWRPEKTTLLSLDSTDSPPSPFVLQQEWQGTRDISAYLSVPTAIQLQAEQNWPRVRQECHELLRYAHQAIGELTDPEQICPDLPSGTARWRRSRCCRAILRS